MVSQKLASFNNSTIILVPPELGSESDFDYISKTFDKYHDLNFKNYCLSISFFPDQYFDLILIDGRCRESCLQLSASKVKKDGFIILDNSERESYWNAVLKNKYVLHKHYFGMGPRLKSFWRTSILKPPLS